MKLLSGKDDGTPQKVTRKEIAGHIEKLGPVGSTLGVTISSPAKKVKNKPTATDPNVPTDDEEILMKDIPLNLNRLNNDAIHATGVDQAIDVLGQLNLGGKDDNGDRNPERRQRAAYNAYRDREMDRLKTEQPTLNYSQNNK
ncbi:Coiled-coil domain-containing protein 124 [Thelohanellus kitauei]|uniref:Coiled-coil domain-containing protein 124 n=1 Tax=Thelohanellus kitauei TaxID=669202 RepID=A0A0C2N8Q8_THEKT|nr:Coiled-coil domain-containing protein 124 [Thelohanellus kitauei]